MIDFNIMMNEELSRLKQRKEELEKLYQNDDGYFLEVKKNKGKYLQFYKCKMIEKGEKSKVQRRFIKKDSIVEAKRLAQRDFDLQILKLINEQILALETAIQAYPPYNGKKIFSSLSETRQLLIDSEYIDDEQFILKWKEKFTGNDSSFNEKYPIETPYYSEKGEHVRSKSEMIIADKLSKAGVPYVYEPVCDLNKKGLHPDFAVLNITTRETYFYEHFGMMDKPEYATAAIRKIAKYRELGYEYGQKLLFTFETGGDGLDIKELNFIIKRYL